MARVYPQGSNVGGRGSLRTEWAQATGRRVPEEDAVVVFRAFACGRGAANACN